ncbi:phosphatase PAP2 family protein [Chitinilyticum litopenaei]|uniref:phosphatase PAP2 family protein n=1 Tax=Chitinilyticum litopenaei TaxID=1121276 RepID=UPI0003FEADFD|nr:phosphatase PAP2 family protein [Chitinilyticum litopenaei]
MNKPAIGRPDRRQFARAHGLGLLLAALLLVLLNYASDWDIRLADHYYDFAAHRFPWRDAWLTSEFGHHWLKLALELLAAALLLAGLRQGLRQGWHTPDARRWLVIMLAIVLVPGVVAACKQFSSLHCPWDIARWGGAAPYLRLFDSLPAGVSPGQCFPAGHATSGLWLLGLVAIWLPQRPRRALAMTPLLLAPGLALGWLQQMRGAHLLSHTLWSVWLAWAIVAALCAWLLFPASAKENRHVRYQTPHQGLGSAAAQPALESGAVRAGQSGQ